MTLNAGLKRKSVLGDFNEILKKLKPLDYSDVDMDDELHIDMDFDVTEKTKVKQTVTRPLDYDSVSVTLSSGHRCYVKTWDDDYVEITNKRTNNTQTASPEYYRLLDEVESMAAKKKLNNSQKSDIVLYNTGGLWVDKYSPKRYGDLLSNESVNRNLLTWIKLWDKYVFKKDSTPMIVNPDTFGEDPFQISEVDNRPIKKIVLLSGPPGIGKTTLAKILARHCGYLVTEMNASNERNAEQFHLKLDSIDSTMNAHVITPSCLIIDEIDGTSLAAINVLISAITAPIKSKEASKHKEKKKLSIKRPVICICNDPYAPSLKNLRPLCYVIRVGTPDYSQMLFRLSDICEWESMSCDRNVISHLIDSSNRDIRSCLNTLQFLKQNGSKTVTVKDLESLNIGNKDMQSGVFTVWEEIFTSTNLKKSYGLSEGKRMNETSQRFNHILKITQATGDIDRVIGGIHENYLSLVRFKDIYLKDMITSTEWFVFNDLTSKKIDTHQSYELMKYKQYIVPYFHLSFASLANVNKRIEWPRSDVNAHFQHQKMHSIFQSFLANQTHVNPWFHDKQELIKVFLPLLSHIIRPHQLRPINIQLFSSKEKIILNNTVNNMISTGLTYIQEKTGELNFQFVLQPNIDALVEFDFKSSDRKPLKYSTKQLIANEVKSEKIRKYAAPIVTSGSTQNRMTAILQMEKAMTTSAVVIDAKKKTSHFRFQVEKKKTEKTPEENNSNVITNLLNQTLLFRFKEGCTNAIRRSVKVKDL